MRLVCAILVAFWASAAIASDATLIVSGQGSASAAPDMAVLSLGVQKVAKSASAAMDDVSGAVADLLANLESAGVAEKDVQTTGLSLSPRYAPPRQNDTAPRVTEYQAANMVTVTVRDLDGLGALLGTVIGDGVNSLNGIQFDITNPAPLQKEAEAKAVRDAYATASVLAEAAGVELGPILQIAEGGGRVGGPQIARSFAAESASVPIAGGQVSRTASVTITYQILP